MHILTMVGAMLVAEFLLHFIIWKVRLPKNQTLSLLIICSAVYCFWLPASLTRMATLPDLVRVSLCYFPVSLSYISLYSVIEMDSPTLSLMCYIAAAGAEGVAAKDAADFLGRRPFFRARMAALFASGLVKVSNDRYVVAGQGSVAFRVILGFRKIYGSIPKGG
jgi:hypothetical protein